MAEEPESVNLYMGQGVVADLKKCTLSSGQFSNCAPVILYNSHTGMGGLYHLPGISTPDRMTLNDQSVLRSLHDQVKPDQVYILSGKDDPNGPLPLGHLKPVTDFLVHNCGMSGKSIHYTVPPEHSEDTPSLQEPVTITMGKISGSVMEMHDPRELSTEISVVSGVSIRAGEDGTLKFGSYKPDVDLSLESEREVSMLLSSSPLQDGSFYGDPDANANGDWITASQSPDKLDIEEDDITDNLMWVDLKRSDFTQLVEKEKLRREVKPSLRVGDSLRKTETETEKSPRVHRKNSVGSEVKLSPRSSPPGEKTKHSLDS